MTELGGGQTIEVVRGGLEGPRAEAVLAFWAERGALEDEAARERLGQVVCLLLDGSSEIAGTNSVHDEAIPLLAGRSLWAYRAFIPEASEEVTAAMFNAAFETLNAEHQVDRSGPVGIVVYAAPDETAAVWPETELAFAGAATDGRHLRVRYFAEAVIAPGMPNSPTQADWAKADHSLGEGYRIMPLAEADAVGPDDVLELWAREGAMHESEARRRVHEVLMVGLDPSDRLAAVSSVYLQRNEQLGMDLWHYRTYVAEAHRMENFSLQLLWTTRDHLRDRYESGEDTRAPGMVMEVENEFLKTYYNTGYWVISDFWFIGEAPNGAHVRVNYFPGARAPASR